MILFTAAVKLFVVQVPAWPCKTLQAFQLRGRRAASLPDANRSVSLHASRYAQVLEEHHLLVAEEAADIEECAGARAESAAQR